MPATPGGIDPHLALDGRTALLISVGSALYGPLNWKAPLARDLRVAVKTVARWSDGTATVPPGVLAELLALAERRAADLTALGQRLRAAAAA